MLKFHSLKVLQLAPDAEDAVAISLDVPPELRAEYLGAAGQHVVVRVSLDGEDTRRTYSLVNAPGEWPLRIVPRVHAQGRMSRHLAEQLRPGDVLEVLPPNGSFTPREPGAGSATYVAFAAGCGITPVLSVVRALLARSGTRVILFYGNTASARAMCLEELLALKDRHLGRLSLHFLMSREPQEVELYNGRIDAQRVRQFGGRLFQPLEVSEYFVCGPGDMIEQVTSTLRELGSRVRAYTPSISRWPPRRPSGSAQRSSCHLLPRRLHPRRGRHRRRKPAPPKSSCSWMAAAAPSTCGWRTKRCSMRRHARESSCPSRAAPGCARPAAPR